MVPKKNTKKKTNKRKKQPKQSTSKKIKTLIVKRQLSNEYMKKKEGEYFPISCYDTIVNQNCDVYYYEDGKKKTLIKFRKKVIPKKLCKIGIKC